MYFVQRLVGFICAENAEPAVYISAEKYIYAAKNKSGSIHAAGKKFPTLWACGGGQCFFFI